MKLTFKLVEISGRYPSWYLFVDGVREESYYFFLPPQRNNRNLFQISVPGKLVAAEIDKEVAKYDIINVWLANNSLKIMKQV